MFRPRAGDEAVASAARPDLERVVYTSLDGVVCLTRAGGMVGASDFEPRIDHGTGPATRDSSTG